MIRRRSKQDAQREALIATNFDAMEREEKLRLFAKARVRVAYSAVAWSWYAEHEPGSAQRMRDVLKGWL